ncbi:MAG TPA: hypothetical protein VFC42_03355 [Methylomirabilota bacterium]|jgi:hypothetical protein|nr:hypothetical protein [Methylomirabilota bacterium]
MMDHRPHPAKAASGPPWRAPLQAAERALEQDDASGAVRAWEQAHLAAVESLSWEGLIAAGDLYLRIGRRTGTLPAADATARRAYFAALYRACRENSFDGVLRAADAFADLGDRDVVDECLGLAELLADGDERRQRLHDVARRTGPAPDAAATGAARP